MDSSLVSAVYTIFTAHSVQVAGFVCLVYDYLLTFSEELLLIWRGKWGLPSLLYLCTRYLAFCDGIVLLLLTFETNAPVTRIRIYVQFVTWCWVIGLITAQNILIVRTYAICNQNRRLLLGPLLVHAGCIAVMFVIMFQALNTITSVLSMESLEPTAGLRKIWVAYLAVLLDETVIAIVTVMFLFRHDARNRKSTPLVRTIQRDGVMFYLYLQVLTLANIILIRFASLEFLFAGASVHRSLHAILTARLVLNMRRAAYPNQGLAGTTSAFVESGSIELHRLRLSDHNV